MFFCISWLSVLVACARGQLSLFGVSVTAKCFVHSLKGKCCRLCRFEQIPVDQPDVLVQWSRQGLTCDSLDAHMGCVKADQVLAILSLFVLARWAINSAAGQILFCMIDSYLRTLTARSVRSGQGLEQRLGNSGVFRHNSCAIETESFHVRFGTRSTCVAWTWSLRHLTESRIVLDARSGT